MKPMTMKQVIDKLKEFPENAQLLIVIPTELGSLETDMDATWHEVAKIEGTEWENGDGSMGVVGIHAGDLIMG